MKIKVIKTEADYEAALTHVATLMDAKLGSAKEDELELWTTLIERYPPPGSTEAEALRLREKNFCSLY